MGNTHQVENDDLLPGRNGSLSHWKTTDSRVAFLRAVTPLFGKSPERVNPPELITSLHVPRRASTRLTAMTLAAS